MNEQKASHHRTFAIAVFMALTVILLGGIDQAQGQWTTNGNNINNTNTGNVGIGTTSPLYGLHIEKTNGSNGNGWSVLIKEAGKNGVLIGSRGSGNAIGTISGVLFDLSGISHLSLNPFGGNVGIGTLAPGNTLELYGANPILKLNDGTNAYQFGFISATGGHPVIYNTRTSNVYSSLRVSGRGAGTSLGGGTFLGGQLQLFGTDFVADSTNFGSSLSLNTFTGAPISGIPVGINFNSQSAGTGVLGAFSFSMNSAVAMTIATNGSVGMGTTTPGYKLDVNGEINATGLRINGTPISTGGGGAVSSVFGRTGAVVAATNDYTWSQINKSTSSLADLATRSAADLSSGTLPDARFPSALPAVSGANLTALNASSLASGTVAPARLGSGAANSTTFLRGDNTWAVPNGSSQWTTSGSSSIYYNSGNVGIGTSSPGTKLHLVSGSANTTSLLSLDTGVYGGTQFQVGGTTQETRLRRKKKAEHLWVYCVKEILPIQ